jgi:uncharacterized damage-inducible protein DinB
MNAKDIVTLIEYNQWANERVIRKLNSMSADALNAPCWLSGGSLLKTVIHLIDTEWSWRVVCQTGTMPPDIPQELTRGDPPKWATVRKFWKTEMAETLQYAKSLRGSQPEKIWLYGFPQAKTRRNPLWHLIMHFTNHSAHHRSEIGQYLHTLGRSPGDMDFLKFVGSQK